jgi:type IV pilus assembly protein PilB
VLQQGAERELTPEPQPGDGDSTAPWASAQRGKSSDAPRIGELMLERGLISGDDLDAALERQRTTGKRMGETLVEIGAISSFDLSQLLAEHLGVPFVDLRARPADLMLAAMVPEEVARRYRALPVARWDGQIVIAMANPEDVFALDDLRVLTGQTVLSVMADPEQLREAIDRSYARTDVESTLGDAASDYEDDTASADLLGMSVEDGPIVRLVNALLERAVDERASDLHVEPSSDRVRVRFRVDGVLHDTSETPLSVLRPIVSRVKVLGGLDIAQTRSPQDGRFSVTVHGRPIDVRVATLPTANGEAIVMRLLDRMRGVMDLGGLGLSETEMSRYEPAFRAPQGAVFVSGPTGSGKTSTLYATLSEINKPDRSIVSVEDPVEYRLDGIKQIQINSRAGVTFPTALRAILRADPDVVLIGEVRDAETAHIAAEASITGHLVFSTLHTTRASAVPMRLVDMGIEPYLVASSLTCVIAQRLARKLCPDCATVEEHPDLDLLRSLGATDEILQGAQFRQPVGCHMCQKTGFRGRQAVYEVMPITEDIGHLVLERASSVTIEHLAVEQGMDTLRIAALRRVARGEFTVDEMLRVIS